MDKYNFSNYKNEEEALEIAYQELVVQGGGLLK